MQTSKYYQFYKRLSLFIPPDRLLTDELRTFAYGTDASFYRLVPKIVVQVESEDEVCQLLVEASTLGVSVTFRGGGTSLSGQAVTDSVLVMLGHAWKKHVISADGTRVFLQPGVVGGHVNAWLAPYGRKIGPDPASINAAMIGGIAANNASGMCCGTAQNSYKTLAGMRIIFANGTLLDTLDEQSRADFARRREDMVSAIAALAADVRANKNLADRITRKFGIKNTTGYSLNALVDYTDPVDIIQHLMIGSEGTLGFIAAVTLHTVPEYAYKASALMIFPEIGSACSAVEALKTCKVDAVELMDRASLRSVETKDGMPLYLRTLGADAAALLVETRAETPAGLQQNIASLTNAVASWPQVIPVEFTDIPAEYIRLWNIRKGLFPSVGAMRQTGTTCIIEDVAFPLPRLAEATRDLQRLFHKHGYNDAIIFGHALEGNLHFVFNQDFNVRSEVPRYARFIDDVTSLVVHTYDGSLKAEHGTGRNMAPFVELEWGADAYALMKALKKIFDPENILNPGVILNADHDIHLKNLKPLPAADPIVDKCIECGFCEVQCPSREVTLTPRQRITAYREMRRLLSRGDDDRRLNSLRNAFRYFGDSTCAADGLCSLTCPVGIDTGMLIKKLRQDSHSPTTDALASWVAGHMAGVTAALRLTLNGLRIVSGLFGDNAMGHLSMLARRMTGDALPQWNRWLPRGANRIRPTDRVPGDQRPTVVYFPSCINRTFGVSPRDGDDHSVIEKTIAVLEKGGYRVLIPEGVNQLCCGMAFGSKGFKKQAEMKARELESALLTVTNGGEHPVYVDMSPCLLHMKETLNARLHLYDPVEFILTFLADRLEFNPVRETVAIHVTCSETKMGLGAGLQKVAELCAARVVQPEGVGCCGWAGDRGFTFPELNAAALRNLPAEIPDRCTGGYSTSRTCEIGLSLHSGISYKSIVYLLDRSTVQKEEKQ